MTTLKWRASCRHAASVPGGRKPVHSAAATDEPLLPRRYCRGRETLEEWRDVQRFARLLPPSHFLSRPGVS